MSSDFVTCEHCGNTWDGNAQCPCDGYIEEAANLHTQPSSPVNEAEDEKQETQEEAWKRIYKLMSKQQQELQEAKKRQDEQQQKAREESQVQVQIIVKKRGAEVVDLRRESDDEAALEEEDKKEWEKIKNEEKDNLDENGNLMDLIAGEDSEYHSSEDPDIIEEEFSESSDSKGTEEDDDKTGSAPPARKRRKTAEKPLSELELKCAHCSKEITGRVTFNFQTRKPFCNKLCMELWNIS